MASLPPTKPRPASWIQDGAILTVASLFAAVGNYLFQALMRRHLPWSEFGYLNATISLIALAGVPLTAASQTVTHHLALIHATGDDEKMARIQAASLKFLRHLTWVVFALCLILIHPVCEFLHFPRMSLVWIALLWIPVSLWSALGAAWCTGLSRFRLLACLLILSAFVRLAAGLLASLYPWAETGVFASILSGLILAVIVVFSPHHATVVRLRKALFDPTLLLYGAAALAASFGAFVFLQGDQIVAQRHFPGEELGRYSGAGLLGRAIVWASLPVLTVYFTRRSGHNGAQPSPRWLLGIYLAMIFGGAIFLLLVKVPLLSLFLRAHDPALTQLATWFALAMIPIGILQALGCHYLAARRIPECLAFGVCGVAYLLVITTLGQTPALMLGWMGGAAWAAVVLLGCLSLGLRLGKWRRQPS